MNIYQTSLLRFGAAFIDFLLCGIILIIFKFIPEIRHLPANTAFSFNVLSEVLVLLYYVLSHYYFGKTFGKAVMHVKVLDIGKTPMSPLQAVLRSLPQLFYIGLIIGLNNSQVYLTETSKAVNEFISGYADSLYISFYLFGICNAFVLLFNKKHRALHDFIAGTVVIKD